MVKTIAVLFFSALSLFAGATEIRVKNIDELKKANKNAKPGDVIILQNGEWSNVSIELNCNGTKEQPITFKAQAAGKVQITGKSRLELGGNYIVVDGLYFINGYAGDNPVINFRRNKDELANNCRVTNTVINDFNNPERMKENYWISFYGKNNRLDHCSFIHKKNMGVLLAVILDDERSRENFHSIDHNYFGPRLPLASNSGEIIRVGVSQHCEFNSNTQITDNLFDRCDGETEIVSIKSCSNVVRNNVFKECQGGVVLRHGNYNTVENNAFLGNGKDGTGGVRIINKGQWVVNNLFYNCRGTGFRSPLSVMNGVPNSPAFRYVAVTDAVVANNSFVNCTPISLCEGSDTERSVPPNKVLFENNIFYNTVDPVIYNSYDDISGFRFSGNMVSTQVKQTLANGFITSPLTLQKAGVAALPVSSTRNPVDDSLQGISPTRIKGRLSATPGFADSKNFTALYAAAYRTTGAGWWSAPPIALITKRAVISCATPEQLVSQLAKQHVKPVLIKLTGKNYSFTEPILIRGNVALSSDGKTVSLQSPDGTTLPYLLQIEGGSTLAFDNLALNLSNLHTEILVSTDVKGSSGHSNFNVNKSTVSQLGGIFFRATKSTMLDSVMITNSRFTENKQTLFAFNYENDKKGYYNVEKLKIINNEFNQQQGPILEMLRGGNDESTMGPLLIFSGNTVTASNTAASGLLISLYGTQRSIIEKNKFSNANTGKILIRYEDAVRAAHTFRNNEISNSGAVITNKFVEEKNNTIH